MGSTGRRSVTSLGPAMFNRTAGTQFKVITGYQGTSDIDIALERGEVDGVALSWAAVTSVHGQKYANGDIIPVFAVADGRMKAIPDVPSMTEFGRDDAEKTFLGIYTSSGTIGRALVFPPGVPADRVAALRDAFEKTISDPEFLAEVKQRQILFDPMSGHGPAGLCRQIHEDAGAIASRRRRRSTTNCWRCLKRRDVVGWVERSETHQRRRVENRSLRSRHSTSQSKIREEAMKRGPHAMLRRC